MSRALGVILALLVVIGCASPSDTRQSLQIHSSQPGTAGPSQSALDPASGLPFVDVADLPPEAAVTIGLITSGGPFPYSQDGVTFDNREGILPDERSGYYHEYTVVTPGSDDRGARRIVTGADGAMYYTSDHYNSFQRIRQ